LILVFPTIDLITTLSRKKRLMVIIGSRDGSLTDNLV